MAPYTAQPLGAFVAGAALARQGTRHRFEGFVAAVLGIAILAAVSFASPSTFGWIAARASHPWPTVFALALACGASGQAGSSLAYGRGGGVSIGVLSTAVTSALLLLGTRVVTTLVHGMVTLDQTSMFAIVYGCAIVAGFAVQSVVPLANAGACASGAAILIAVQVIDAEMRGGHTEGLVWLLFTVAAAFVGALAAQRLRPRPQPPVAAAFE